MVVLGIVLLILFVVVLPTVEPAFNSGGTGRRSGKKLYRYAGESPGMDGIG